MPETADAGQDNKDDIPQKRGTIHPAPGHGVGMIRQVFIQQSHVPPPANPTTARRYTALAPEFPVRAKPRQTKPPARIGPAPRY